MFAHLLLLRNQRLQREEEKHLWKAERKRAQENLNTAVEREHEVGEMHRMEIEDGLNALNRCWERIVQPRLMRGLTHRWLLRRDVEQAWRDRYHEFEADAGVVTPPMPKQWMPEHEDNFVVYVGDLGYNLD